MRRAALAPHRAVYDLALDNASDRSGITGISGRMVYEFNGSACEGYTVTFRFVTQIDTGEASRSPTSRRPLSRTLTARRFSFVTKSFVDQNLDKEVRGNATRENPAASRSRSKGRSRSSTCRRRSFRPSICSS